MFGDVKGSKPLIPLLLHSKNLILAMRSKDASKPFYGHCFAMLTETGVRSVSEALYQGCLPM